MNQNIKEDFLDILLYLFEYYSEDPMRESDTSFVIRDHLIDAGFQDVAIDHAMDWVEIFKNSKEGIMLHTPSNSSVRILSDDEKNLLDVECQNYISRLEKFGLLTPEKRELLIDKLTSIGFEPMDLEVVKALSILMLFQEPSVEVKLHAYENEEIIDSPKTLN
jgi:Smg protein